MALYSDAGPSLFDDWISYDSKLLILSEQESTSIELKANVAKSEIASELIRFFLKNEIVNSLNRELLVRRVAVTEPLKRWHAMLTLSMYYEDLAALQVNQSSFERALQFKEKAELAKVTTFETGVGMVDRPIPQPLSPKIELSEANVPNFQRKAKTQFENGLGSRGAASREFWVSSTNGSAVSLAYGVLPDEVVGWYLYLQEADETYRAVNSLPIPAGSSLLIDGLSDSSGEMLHESGQTPDRYITLNTSRRL